MTLLFFLLVLLILLLLLLEFIVWSKSRNKSMTTYQFICDEF